MDLSARPGVEHSAELEALAAAVGAASGPVVAVGARTQFDVGDPVPVDATPVTGPVGVIRFEPADLTVTVGAATTVRDLEAELGEAGQEVPLDPRDPNGTVGGVLATGLSGHRRLGRGPVRDTVLEVRFATADGRVVKGGGPTVKNVSGYDMPRLLVGSMGTLGVLGQLTLRARARPRAVRWLVRAGADPMAIRRGCPDATCIAWTGGETRVLLEGHPVDLDAQAAATGLVDADPPVWPSGPHRARLSVRPGVLVELADALDGTGARWCAEIGVGTVHIAADDPAALARARLVAHEVGGWMLREAGAPELSGFGVELPNRALARRIKDAFDPDHKLSPGRMPL